MRLKVKKVLALASTKVMLSSVVVMADYTNKREYEKFDGYVEMTVRNVNEMKNCRVWNGNEARDDNYSYRTELITTYDDGSQEIQKRGFSTISVSIERDYEWTEDYLSKNYAKITICL